jgi:hypothetical protein
MIPDVPTAATRQVALGAASMQVFQNGLVRRRMITSNTRPDSRLNTFRKEGHPVASGDRLSGSCGMMHRTKAWDMCAARRGCAVEGRIPAPDSGGGVAAAASPTTEQHNNCPKVVRRRRLEPIIARSSGTLIHVAAPHLEHQDRSDLDEPEGAERSTSRAAAAVPAIIAGDNGSDIPLRHEAKVVNVGNSSPPKLQQNDRVVVVVFVVEAAHVLQHVPKDPLIRLRSISVADPAVARIDVRALALAARSCGCGRSGGGARGQGGKSSALGFSVACISSPSSLENARVGDDDDDDHDDDDHDDDDDMMTDGGPRFLAGFPATRSIDARYGPLIRPGTSRPKTQLMLTPGALGTSPPPRWSSAYLQTSLLQLGSEHNRSPVRLR